MYKKKKENGFEMNELSWSNSQAVVYSVKTIHSGLFFSFQGHSDYMKEN